MKKSVCLFAIGILVAGAAVAQGAVESPAPKSDYVSPEFLAVSADAASVFATSATGAKILRVKLADGTTTSWTIASSQVKDTPVNPTGIAAANGSVYVTCGVQAGELQQYREDGTLVGTTCVGHSPCAPVVTKDGKTAYVMNRFENKVSVVDLAARKVVKTVKVLREPFAAALGANEKLLFVANMLPYCAATNDIVAASVSVIDTATGAAKHILLPNGSTGVRGLGVSPDGKSVYVTHSMGRYQLPTTQLERGWMNTAALSVFDGVTGAYVNTVLLDDVDRGAANPWGVAVTADGKTLVVAHAGTCELSLIDRAALHDRLEKAAKGQSASGIVKSAEDVPNDLAFLVSIRRRVLAGGDGPRGVVAVGRTAVTALYFADAVSTFCLDEASATARLLAVGPAKDLTKDRVRRGEMLYNDGSMCFQQWQSCASCHPDGRIDGLNWDLLNDGMGNPKQTKSELYTHCTPPTMVTGIRPDMHACNMAGLVHIQFVTRPEEDVHCFDAYCTSMKPVPSPYLVNGQLSARAKRGEQLFRQAKCADCHKPDAKGPAGEALWSDLKLYDVGLGTATETGRKFDTPTLTECWRTAPYLYDGRALTMEEVLTTANPGDRHGETSKFTPDQIKDLAEYVLSL
ncbi:MAG: c-type cytochrome [Kiritimatiellae bacterium]|nr:c-type cytochrome [Kiritimatiellia bacterium]